MSPPAPLQVPVHDVFACPFRFCAPPTPGVNTTTCCIEWQPPPQDVVDGAATAQWNLKNGLLRRLVMCYAVLGAVLPVLPYALRCCSGAKGLRIRRREQLYGQNNQLALALAPANVVPAPLPVPGAP